MRKGASSGRGLSAGVDLGEPLYGIHKARPKRRLHAPAERPKPHRRVNNYAAR